MYHIHQRTKMDANGTKLDANGTKLDANGTKKETLADCRRCTRGHVEFVSGCYPYTLAKFATIDSRRPKHNVEEMSVEWI